MVELEKEKLTEEEAEDPPNSEIVTLPSWKHDIVNNCTFKIE